MVSVSPEFPHVTYREVKSPALFDVLELAGGFARLS
jgi:hypothetical protein